MYKKVQSSYNRTNDRNKNQPMQKNRINQPKSGPENIDVIKTMDESNKGPPCDETEDKKIDNETIEVSKKESCHRNHFNEMKLIGDNENEGIKALRNLVNNQHIPKHLSNREKWIRENEQEWKKSFTYFSLQSEFSKVFYLVQSRFRRLFEDAHQKRYISNPQQRMSGYGTIDKTIVRRSFPIS